MQTLRMLLLGFIILLWTASCSAPTPPVRLTTGDYSVAFTPADQTLRLWRGSDVLLTFPAAAFQLGMVGALDPDRAYDPYWLEEVPGVVTVNPPADLTWRAPSSATLAPATPAAPSAPTALAVTLDYGGGLGATLSIEASATGRFAASLVPSFVPAQAGAIAWMRLRPQVDPTEGFYGLGEWPDDVNHRGKIRPMQIEAAPTESGDDENHVPVPLLIGTNGWGLFIESRLVGVFNVAAAQPDLVQITYGTAEQSAAGLRFHLLAADQPLDVPRLYYDITGYPVLPAPWALGPWIWRHDTGQSEVLADVASIRAMNIPTSALWIDDGYFSAVETFDFQAALYPDPAAMIQTAQGAGLQVALWHVPYLEPSAQPYRAQADAAGYFPKKSGILLNGWSAPLDFTNPAAYSFWQGLLMRYTGLGVAGFKLDYGEDIVPDLADLRNQWLFADGSDERTMHYGYTLLYHRVYAEMLPKTGGFLLCRTGRWGDQAHVSVIWPGDMDSSFTSFGESYIPPGATKAVVGVGGLPATLIQGMNLSASGFPFFGADTGGYRHTPPDRELYIRWFEQTAFSTVMQVGDASNETPWEFLGTDFSGNAITDAERSELLALYQTYAGLHLRLFPYEWTYAQNIQTDGRPIQRALGLAYPALGVHPTDEYLLGDDILVAPVVTRGQVQRQVVLPAGEWISWWDGTSYQGGQVGGVTVPAPLGNLPVLLRAGAIIPLLRPTVATLAPATQAGVDSYANQAGPLYVRLVPGPAATSFTLFDGTVIGQGTASGATPPITPPITRQITLKPGTVFLGGPAQQAGATLELLRTPQPGAVTIVAGGNSTTLPQQASLAALSGVATGWAWDSTGPGTLWIKIGAGPQTVNVQ